MKNLDKLVSTECEHIYKITYTNVNYVSCAIYLFKGVDIVLIPYQF